MISKTDQALLTVKGISPEKLQQQLTRFKNGFRSLNVLRPATENDGIRVLTKNDTIQLINSYEAALKENLTVGKFVPASGAATRMFKDLYQFLEQPEAIDSTIENQYINQFLEQLDNFAFFPLLKAKMTSGDLENRDKRKLLAKAIVSAVLNENGLNYGQLPKGLLHFHQSNGRITTAMEDQIGEGCRYVKNADGRVKIHFTVSPEHHPLFSQKLEEVRNMVENLYDSKLDVSFSFQKPHTDTIAVTPENTPFRDENGELVFRPGGHGALIENLNDQDFELIFIKNIDNIVPSYLWSETITYKKALAGLLLQLKNKIFAFLRQLDNNSTPELYSAIEQFLKDDLHVRIPPSIGQQPGDEQKAFFKHYLDRPIRVCGMVRNEGEPGGGPFWVAGEAGLESLQILESSQLNLSDSHQATMIKEATHFNPVDLVCYTYNYRGQKFNLTRYTDPETGFISNKTLNGKHVKALELPGLWNGAMANWVTLFVEVPISTFNPVKTVNDLLRSQHQPKK
ncbi:DUF4301 family protein [Geofilum sp. OHC36d9]|uniref:DUF4301 family protein n=1 Tax=Geofilum sp. OHC36d9 TaxID=3458413 RepID=UPI0040336368